MKSVPAALNLHSLHTWQQEQGQLTGRELRHRIDAERDAESDGEADDDSDDRPDEEEIARDHRTQTHTEVLFVCITLKHAPRSVSLIYDIRIR